MFIEAGPQLSPEVNLFEARIQLGKTPELNLVEARVLLSVEARV